MNEWHCSTFMTRFCTRYKTTLTHSHCEDDPLESDLSPVSWCFSVKQPVSPSWLNTTVQNCKPATKRIAHIVSLVHRPLPSFSMLHAKNGQRATLKNWVKAWVRGYTLSCTRNFFKLRVYQVEYVLWWVVSGFEKRGFEEGKRGLI